ncbi:hypothetical protein M436DRAFT_65103 [Aureobasidium namibiae CBS 147.97]|uniref:Transmembrane protein n=1 Tax=Aureobasidium namibiae CBS 147.97 TaxID=1043004 RepID=A0A074WPK6_9PEZI|nr:uncharacterized protein M436DRAFT_65103 [Aureobasidium namibiae CBS 147.97]KEQ71612.1 hypothetical protein M436DRAFT_65103 [Aureobasidium namibiae CBS 147.97]
MQSSTVLETSGKRPMIPDKLNKKPSASLSSSERPISSLSNDEIAFHSPVFVLATGVASAAFWVLAAGVCPLSANDRDVNKTQCGIGITFGLVFLLVGGLAAFGLIHSDKRKIDGGMAPFLDDSDVNNGYAVSTESDGASINEPHPTGVN